MLARRIFFFYKLRQSTCFKKKDRWSKKQVLNINFALFIMRSVISSQNCKRRSKSSLFSSTTRLILYKSKLCLFRICWILRWLTPHTVFSLQFDVRSTQTCPKTPTSLALFFIRILILRFLLSTNLVSQKFENKRYCFHVAY